MSAEGSGATRADPSANDLDELRRRVFGGGQPTTADLAAYDRLTRSPVDREPAVPAVRNVPSAPRLRNPPSRSSVLRRIAIVVAAVLVATGVAAVVVVLRGTEQVDVRSLAPPSLAGETIAAYGRRSDPAVRSGTRTYQPEGYTVFQPAGRVVHVAFRCVGQGDVRLFAGAVYRYRCTDREQQWTRSRGGTLYGPFMVVATTTGDVVWSVRVVLREP